MKLYLDNCCYNRPFDDQKSIRVKLETEAKLFIQDKVKQGEYKIVWSYILEYENSANPFVERKEAVNFWKDIAIENVPENKEILNIANEIAELGVKSKDTLHLACAINSKCMYFLTTDDILLKKTKNIEKIKVVNPLEFISQEIEYGSE